jgi:anthranilate phosphoribosyltransferase
MEFKAALSRVIAKHDLPREVIEQLFGQLMDGELSDAQKSALLIALACKGESVDEIVGAASAMRARFVAIPHHLDDVIDTCGTGGDGTGSFNVSTAAALVAAGAGARVAKHGNRSISSRSGSADVLEQLGVALDLKPEDSGRCLSEVGLAFLFAPAHHPAMREVMPVRRDLGVRTLFNVLGPLTNPAGARRQLMGVYSRDLVVKVAEVLLELGSEHALVVHGGGLDEIALSGKTLVGEVKDGRVDSYTVAPEDFGLTRRGVEAIAGGDPAHNAQLLGQLLAGERGPALEGPGTEGPDLEAIRDITLLNAGAALYVAGRAESIAEGIETARSALDSGDALRALERLRSFS